MASILKVDTIQDQDGNNIISEAANTITIGASGDTITIPSGATLANSGIVTGFQSTGIDDNATSTALTINGANNATFSGIVTADQFNLDSGGDLHSTIDTSSVTVAGGTNSNVGANISVYGSSHSSLASVVRFRAGSSETMRIDSSGNVGIGTSSPSGRLDVLDNTGSLSATQDITAEFHRNDGTNNPRLQIRHSTTGSDIHHTYGSGADKLTITLAGTERMRFANSEVVFNEDGNDKDFRVESSTDSLAFSVDGADGRVRIGSFGSNGKLNVSADGFSTSHLNPHIMLRNGNNTGGVGTGDKTLIMSEVTSSGGAPYRPVAFGAENTQHTLREGAFVVYVSDSQTVDLSTDERLRITNDGNVGIGTSSPASKFESVLATAGGNYSAFLKHSATSGTTRILRGQFSGHAPNDTNSVFITMGDNTATRFNVFANGDVTNSNNSYTGISDIKLKEQIVDASSQWEDIKNIPIKKFKFKTDVATGDNDKHWRLGVIAQEVEQISPSLVSETTDLDDNHNELDTVTKSVKYSILYMKAVKALQEAMERIETLEAKVQTLENNNP